MKEDISRCSEEQSVLLKVRIENLEKQIESINRRLKSAFSVASFLFPDRDTKARATESQSDSKSVVENDKPVTEEQGSNIPEDRDSSDQAGKEDVAKTSPKGFSKGSSQCSKFIRVGKS